MSKDMWDRWSQHNPLRLSRGALLRVARGSADGSLPLLLGVLLMPLLSVTFAASYAAVAIVHLFHPSRGLLFRVGLGLLLCCALFDGLVLGHPAVLLAALIPVGLAASARRAYVYWRAGVAAREILGG